MILVIAGLDFVLTLVNERVPTAGPDSLRHAGPAKVCDFKRTA